jgi:hypothetical protein
MVEHQPQAAAIEAELANGAPGIHFYALNRSLATQRIFTPLRESSVAACCPLMLGRLRRRRASTQMRCALSITLIDQTARCYFLRSPLASCMGGNGVALENAPCPGASENIESPKALAGFSARVPNIDVSVGKGGREQ